ncbi:DUF4329 domain-containing protein [Sphingomonas sp. RP10(2022)]|uniref:DUF4329 domain-containing protein n=1 Tax=Sphingomonas liriopis TaxID=2949094 RepID=A0A9X2KQM1_9SPHN|nr:DUF4329 domain-containing protein [Sphingomonas liriopis]MCP3735115.1 DUF4329 domain-containing protein [Sphingomonas liriopis]
MSALTILTLSAAIAQQAPAAPPPAATAPTEAQRLAQSASLGRLVYALDRAAWVSSDALTAQVPKDQLGSVGGYVVEIVDGKTLRVTYYRGAAAEARAFFTADVRDLKVVSSERLATPVPLTPTQAMLAAARTTAAKTAVTLGYRPCTPVPFNTVVLPPRSGGPAVVYLLTAQQDARRYVMGGNYRVVVAADGTVLSTRPYDKSCRTVDLPSLPPGAKPVGFVVNHLLDPVPTEMHVFASYSLRMPVFVSTPDGRRWKVASDAITPMAAPPAQ